MPLVRDFSVVLGPVGMAKALHALAPDFFPPWDHRIADAYGINLMWVGTETKGFYWKRFATFMAIRRKQVESLSSRVASPLKALDEWDYMRITRGRKDL